MIGLIYTVNSSRAPLKGATVYSGRNIKYQIKPLKGTTAERKITITEKRYKEEVKKIKNRIQKANPNPNSIPSSSSTLTPSTSGMTSSNSGSRIDNDSLPEQTPGPSGLTKK